MAIAPTGAIYKALKFDGVSSRTYGVYITGEAVYNAPERDVEMITIPGRNGSFALDNGRFQNIEVSYPAGIFAETEADFRAAISDFRNFLCSRNGYVRLQDEYNPDEYRMAVYKSGLEVDPAMLKAGEFTITFDCKPQRWLTSGETEVAVDSGDTLTNPTLFESSPLLEIEGTGDIEFNGYTVSIESSDIGEITIPYTDSGSSYIFDDVSQLNTGDTITVSGFGLTFKRVYLVAVTGVTNSTVISCTGLDGTQYTTTVRNTQTSSGRARTVVNEYALPDITLEYGTPYQVVINGRVRAFFSGGGSSNYILGETITITYDGDDSLSYTTQRVDDAGTPSMWHYGYSETDPTVTAYSTKPYDYGTIYCDTDIGEFYRIEGGEYISMNHVGDLGSDLPTLAPGTNTVTYDNTITELNIAPRWWKI